MSMCAAFFCIEFTQRAHTQTLHWHNVLVDGGGALRHGSKIQGIGPYTRLDSPIVHPSSLLAPMAQWHCFVKWFSVSGIKASVSGYTIKRRFDASCNTLETNTCSYFSKIAGKRDVLIGYPRLTLFCASTCAYIFFLAVWAFLRRFKALFWFGPTFIG